MIALLLALSSSALGCSCMDAPTVAEARARADAVFVGRLVQLEGGERSQPLLLELHATAGWKGVEPRWQEYTDPRTKETWRRSRARMVTVHTASQPSACGLAYPVVGEDWLIYAEEQPDGSLLTTACDRSTRAVAAEWELLGEPAWSQDLAAWSAMPMEAALEAGDPVALEAALDAGDNPMVRTRLGLPVEVALEQCAPELLGPLVARLPDLQGAGLEPGRIWSCPADTRRALFAVLRSHSDGEAWWLQQALARTVVDGDLERTRVLLEAGFDPNLRFRPSDAGETCLAGELCLSPGRWQQPPLLSLAWEYGHEAVGDLLVAHGAEVGVDAWAGLARSVEPSLRSRVLEERFTPAKATRVLLRAPIHPEVVEHLLAEGARPGGAERSGASDPVLDALDAGCAVCAERLLEAGARATRRAAVLVVEQRQIDLIPWFPPGEYRWDDVGWPLHQAVAQDDVAMVGALLDAGWDADQATGWRSQGWRPLHKSRSEAVVGLLLDAGADPTVPAPRKGTDQPMLARAAAQADLGALRRLLDAGVPVDQSDPEPVVQAVRREDGDGPAVVELLLELGLPTADALAWARDAETVQRLLDAGADPAVMDLAGRVPLGQAARRADVDSVTALLEAGVDPDLPDRQGRTALMLVAGPRIDGTAVRPVDDGVLPEVARVLLLAGADPTAVDHNGQDAIAIARQAGREALAGILERWIPEGESDQNTQ